MSTSVLFEPIQIRGLALKNRIVMAPMTRSFSPSGLPGSDVAEYYRRRAAGDVGLIISEGTVIDRPASKSDPDVPNFFGEALNGWEKVVDGVHQAGGKIAPQLWHVGAARGPNDKTDPRLIDSPSGLFKPGAALGQPMTEEAIADTVAAFCRSAEAAVQLGCDAVELHGAHGYLIDQFLWAGTNVRQDAWGGNSVVERARFAVEILRKVRAAIGDRVPLILRLSQWKQQDLKAKLAHSPQELEALLVPLAEAGVDIFHCSQRRFWEAEFEGSTLNLAGWAKKITGKPSIAVGSVGLQGDFMNAFRGEGAAAASLDGLLERLGKGEFDLVAVGRALITDPNWVRKVSLGLFNELKGFERESLNSLV